METERFLDKLYEDLKALELVGNQYDFSVMCGRTPSWYSTLKARRLPITTDAALSLSYNIRQRVAHRNDCETAIALSEAVMSYAEKLIANKLALKQAGHWL